jgi:hypothetical protein
MFMPRQLNHAVEQIARQAIGKDWALYASLLEHWKEIVGPDYARVTTPVKINFPHQPNEARRRNGTLTVRLPKGLAMEFTYKTEQICQRINNYFGYDAIAKIMFDAVYGVAPKTQKQFEADPEALSQLQGQTQSIQSNELRDALQSFGEAMIKRPHEKA